MGIQLLRFPITMKSILSLVILVLVTVIQAMPRYVLIPIEDVAFMQPPRSRSARAACPPPPGPSFALPKEILAAEEQIALGSEYAETVKGDDAVDYGAYTGGYGAFGHYASYPNFEGIGGR